MLLQTNSYIVPQEKRAEHARLMRRFRQALHKVGCDNFEGYEQVGANWGGTVNTGRFVQIMRFRDRKHQLAVQNAERSDAAAQALIAEFCELINYPYQQQQQQFVVGFYASALPVAPLRDAPETAEGSESLEGEVLVDEESPGGDIGVGAAETAAADISGAGESVESGESLEGGHVEASVIEDEISTEAEADAGTEAEAEAEAVAEAMETEAVETPEAEADAASYFDSLTERQAGEHKPAAVDDATIEDLFDDDDAEAFAEEHTPEAASHEAAEEASGEELLSESPHPDRKESPESDADLESDLAIEVDDISRLAEELAAGDDELDDPRQPDRARHGRDRASGNGAH